MTAVLVIAAGATWAMVGVIWQVQLVQYPMLAAVPADRLCTAAQDHQRRITWVVGPLMAIEGVTALVLLAAPPAEVHPSVVWAAAVLLAVALGSTVVEQVPLHRRIAQGADVDAARRLVTTNWIRTGAWTGRGVLLAGALAA